MSVLPSPVPHPLDYSPWELPGWIYEALDWVVGVEWPEGDERAVWDLADQWYAVATALAGPRADAVAAAGDVRSGHGGAVGEAFDAAWRRLAEGDDAPLPVLLAVSSDLGRMVEECGCDIEGAKLEVWIELGILVVELLSLAVAAVLTAGAASPAAGPAVMASRMIVQQIMRRLTGQLARKSLKHGLREAGERAARQVAEGGVRGLARRAAVGGLAEAAEESGVSLATQAYQNTTGRRHGLDLTDLGASALGGLAGGAAAPLAGLGGHATGRGARVGEHLGREMAGEVIAETAAGLATGQGPISLEDAARAAVSGGTGSATAQADAALRARLDGRLSVLADTAATPVGLPVDAVAPPPEPVTPGPEPSAAGVGAGSGALASGPMAASEPVPPSGVVPSSVVVPVSGVVPASGAASGADVPLSAPVEAPTPRLPSDVPPPAGPGALSTGAAAAPDALLTAAAPPGDPVTGGSPNGQPVGTAPSPALSSAGAAAMSPQATVSSVGGTVTAEPAVSSTGIPSSPVAPVPPAATAPGPSTPAPPAVVASPSSLSGGAAAPGPPPSAPTTVASPSSVGGSAAPSAPPAAGLPAAPLAAGVPAAPPAAGPSHTAPIGSSPPSATPTAARPASPGLPAPPVDPGPAGVEGLRPRTPEWYAATWAADRDAFERRRYRGHFAHQRTTHEENRRRERAAELRVAADRTLDEARWLVGQGRVLAYAGRHADAERYFREGRDRERWCHQQRDLAEAVLAGSAAPSVVGVGEQDFHRINDDVGDLATGGVETPDRSALTGDDHPPPIDRSRDYGRPGGLRPPLALHQTDVERQVPRDPDGRVTRTADPRRGGWFRLMNDGGPAADPTRGINCVDCALSLFDTWMHGRPRVAAPRTFDAYAAGNVNRPLHGEQHGPRRVEDVTGGRFQRLCQPDAGSPPGERRHAVDQGYRNLHDQLLLGGHGSYAFVINTWEGGGSHIWVALNQNGTVLYLDPQTGRVAPQPLYRHTGAAFAYNVVDLDVLVLGPDGRPMPMAGLRRGQFSVRPDLPDHPPATEHEGYGEPYVNRIHSLAGPGSALVGPPTGSGANSATPESQLSDDERSVLSLVREQAISAADRVEASLRVVAQKVTYHLGLDRPLELPYSESRIKSFRSLARKYVDEAQVVGVPAEDFAREVNDVLRFTLVLPPMPAYPRAVDLVLRELTRAGFVVPDAACKNFWRSGNRFYGFNCTVLTPDGVTFELQLHTEASCEVWQRTHEAYEQLRRASQPPDRRVHGFLQMLAVNRSAGLPNQVPSDLQDRFPSKDTTFAKWIVSNGSTWRHYLRWLEERGLTFSEVTSRFGLTTADFPLSQSAIASLEKVSVDLLRRVPK